ncbi:glycoside hydrolase family 99-like domain-containing protein [Parabacteroides sp. Marseille-P3160]|uniref:glycoside hydrolase family 99-like domain-containing protein n=1 Tax=Parabacteroides sp. Marseille-P3160 TaxID=1917887 RepID=UPI0009BB5F04|nr:glycoside hydrolase family 99-like domain-containing protein [Parabacteroides sp. Marseille-P3160]
MKKRLIIVFPIILILFLGIGCNKKKNDSVSEKREIMVGTYYFDGWSGTNRHAGNPDALWAKNAPTHLSEKLATDYSSREPIWGWRNDSIEIMERQIDLAAENGIDFFLFCWYWAPDKAPLDLKRILSDPKHTSLALYLQAKNKNRVKFALLIANHQGHEITGEENWQEAVSHWMPYFKDDQYLKVSGKPLLVLFNPQGITDQGLADINRIAITNNLQGLSIAGCGDHTIGRSGFDIQTYYNIVPGYSANSEPHDYEELVAAGMKKWNGTKEQPCIPTVTVGWDKRPWEGSEGGLYNTPEGWYYTNQTPDKLKDYIRSGIKWINDNPEKATQEKIIFLYAWNELGEGGYLVPTKGDPDGLYLKAVKESIEYKK